MISYEELLKKSDKNILFLEKINLANKAKVGRFGYYKKFISGLSDAIKNDKKDFYLSKTDSDNNKYWEIGLFALKEFFELVEILTTIEKLYDKTSTSQQDEITQRISKILEGKAYTKDELPSNSKARNFQFELLIGAKIFDSGNENIVFGEHPDVLVNVGTLKYAIECKRILGKFNERLIERSSEALEQLNKIKKDVFTGIIAFDVSTKYEQGKNLLASNNTIEAADYAQKCLKDDLSFLYQKNPKIIKAGKKGFLISMFASVSSVYAINGTNESGHINQISVLCLAKENPGKSSTYLRDFIKLQN